MKYIISVIICSFLVVGCLESKGEKQHMQMKKQDVEVYYTCPMHPQIKEKKEGKCPICGMQLTKVVVDHSHEDTDGQKMDMSDSTMDEEIVAKVKLRKSQLKHFKADVFSVTKMKMQKKIRLLGTVLKAEDKESNIPARIPGRVEKVFVQSAGFLIKKGDPVVKIYSPRLLSSGDEYLIARKNYFSNKKNKQFKELYEQSIQRMRQWGILSFQLESWAKKNKIPREIIIYSPVTGIVEKKNAIKGKYFKEGQSFFNLVDLSTLWVELDVYEHDSALVKIGQSIEIEFSAYPGELWSGTIDFISPVLDQKTRTLKIRTTLENLEGKLRPGMVGTASVTLQLDSMPLVIPRTAIIDTGERKVVWLDTGNNSYQAKTVRTGFESEGYVEVKHGLREGEKVVIDGNFLLDAQAQLFGGYEDMPSSTGHQHH